MALRVRDRLLRLLRRLGWPGLRVRRSRWLQRMFRDRRDGGFHHHRHRQLSYRLYLPARMGRTEGLPLLLMLHGCRQTAEEFAAGTRINAAADEHGCAVLYPEQSRIFNMLGCWNWFEPEALAGHGEAALIVRATRHVIDRYRLDAARVYVAGLSAGGAMAALLCATHGDLFAACAIHSGVMFHAATGSTQALRVMQSGHTASQPELLRRIAAVRAPGSRSVPTLILHGSEDRTVHPVNAEQLAQQLCALAEHHHPEHAAPTLRKERWIEGDGRRYRLQDYSQDGRLLLRSVLIEGLGHAWSGGDARYRFHEAEGPDASRLVLQFLLQHSLDRMGLEDAARNWERAWAPLKPVTRTAV
jgi:poly(hydroxyalkanoate) depolymerase family esterase